MRLSTPPPQNLEEPLGGFFASDGKIGLLYGNAPLTRVALYGITLAAVANHAVWVIDGANSFDAYFVARLARSWNHAPESILSRIHLSRSFTCYQLTESITRRLTLAPAKSTHEKPGKLGADSQLPCHSTTIFCIGLLDTFYDEDVPMADAVRLLRSIIASLTGMAQSGHTVFITAREPRQPVMQMGAARPGGRRVLMNLLIESATLMKRIDWLNDKATAPVPTQLKLITV